MDESLYGWLPKRNLRYGRGDLFFCAKFVLSANFLRKFAFRFCASHKNLCEICVIFVRTCFQFSFFENFFRTPPSPNNGEWLAVWRQAITSLKGHCQRTKGLRPRCGWTLHITQPLSTGITQAEATSSPPDFPLFSVDRVVFWGVIIKNL